MTTDARGEDMKRFLALFCKIVLVLIAPQFALGQWTDGQEGRLVIRGGHSSGCLTASVMSADRTRNRRIVIQDGEIVEVDADVDQQQV